jgi:flagellar basal body-associated protein FliL
MPEDLKEKLENSKTRRRTYFVPAAFMTVAALVIAGIWFWTSRDRGSPDWVPGDPKIPYTLHLDTFVLNLADPEQRSYLRAGIDLGLNHELKREEESACVSKVRDTILSVLAETKGGDLITAAGKGALKKDVLQALQQRVPQLGVEEVYFTEFLIQR